MSDPVRSAFHTVDDEWLAAYSAGGLSPGKRLVISCQAAMQPELAARLATLDHVSGALLETAAGEALSDDFMSRVLGGLDAEPPVPHGRPGSARDSGNSGKPAWMPEPLHLFMQDEGLPLAWRAAGPGIERLPLCQAEDGERIYLLRARPGFQIPAHGHRGEEWTLIMEGSYHVGPEGYVAGDLHREDETCTHRFVVDEDGPCTCLVAIEGTLKFQNPLLKMLQPLLGI